MKEVSLIFLIFFLKFDLLAEDAKIWMKYEIRFESEKIYNNPIYAIKDFNVTFTSPSGQTLNVNGFLDGGKNWKVRFCPNETGTWKWNSFCSDAEITQKDGIISFYQEFENDMLVISYREIEYCIYKHISLNLYIRGINQSPTIAINELSKKLNNNGNII